MNEESVTEASNFLVRLWQEGGHVDAMPEHLRPATRAEAYAVQARVERQSQFPLAGWKIAATSGSRITCST